MCVVRHSFVSIVNDPFLGNAIFFETIASDRCFVLKGASLLRVLPGRIGIALY
jgi:hypothetical protein